MSGFSFGTPAATPTIPTAFGTPQTTAPAANQFSFGGNATSTTLGTAAPLGSTTLGSVSLNTSVPSLQNASAAAKPSFGFSLGTPATSAPPAFGSTTSTFGAAPVPQTNTLSVAPVSQTSTSSFSFGLSTTAPQQSIAPAAAPIQIQPQTVQTPQQNTTTGFVGLGGLDMSATQQKVPEGKVEVAKETNIPSQIVQTVEDFKVYVKNQKTISSEIARSSDRKLKTVTDEIQRMNCLLNEASHNIDRNRAAIRNLRNETSKVIVDADMAQRTHETPTGLQFENVMPQIYFKDLIQKYETDLLNLKQQVELTEAHLQSLANPQNFSAQDLKKGLRNIYESFIALAGRLQEAHTKVEAQKTKYLELRKALYRETTNVFEESESTASKNARVQYGPNAFTHDTSHFGLLNLSLQQKAVQQQQQMQQQTMPQQNPLGQTSFFSQPTSSFSFGPK